MENRADRANDPVAEISAIKLEAGLQWAETRLSWIPALASREYCSPATSYHSLRTQARRAVERPKPSAGSSASALLCSNAC